MATAPAKKLTPAPAKTTAIVPWEKDMAAAAERGAKAEKPVGMFSSIAIGQGILKIDDVPIPGNRMRGIVLCATPENQYYDRPYDAQNPTSPVCFSFGDPTADEPEDGMAPHETSTTKQGDANGLCAECWANVMGSAEIGKGKACKNIRRMLIMPEDAIENGADGIKKAEVRMLKVPVMSVKGWVNYVRQTLFEEMKRPMWGVITEISLVPDPKSQFRVMFEFSELINFDQKTYDAMKAKVSAMLPQLITPYPPVEETPAPAPRGRAPAPQRTAAPGKPVGVPVKPGMAGKSDAAAGKRAAKY